MDFYRPTIRDPLIIISKEPGRKQVTETNISHYRQLAMMLTYYVTNGNFYEQQNTLTVYYTEHIIILPSYIYWKNSEG
jgi:hypothetical protein